MATQTPNGTSLNIGGISVWEKAGSGNINYSKDKITATREFFVPWISAQSFVTFHLIQIDLVGGSVATIPAQSFPNFPNLISVGATIKPIIDRDTSVGSSVPNSSSGPSYGYADVTINYETKDRNLDTFLQTEINFSVEKIQAPVGKYKAGNPLETIDENIAISIPEIEFSITEFNVAKIDVGLISFYVGKTNSNTFFGAPPGKVLYLGASSSSSFSPSGVVFRDITHHIKIRSRDWNYVLLRNQSDGTPDQQWGPVTPLIYDSADFNSLFQIVV